MPSKGMQGARACTLSGSMYFAKMCTHVGGWVERVAYTSVKGEGVLVLSFNDQAFGHGPSILK